MHKRAIANLSNAPRQELRSSILDSEIRETDLKFYPGREKQAVLEDAVVADILLVVPKHSHPSVGQDCVQPAWRTCRSHSDAVQVAEPLDRSRFFKSSEASRERTRESSEPQTAIARELHEAHARIRLKEPLIAKLGADAGEGSTAFLTANWDLSIERLLG
jgi:hypothetical protein